MYVYGILKLDIVVSRSKKHAKCTLMVRQHEAAKPVQILAHRLRKALGKLDQQRVAAPGIAACLRWRLVRHLFGHALSFSAGNGCESEASGGFIDQAST